MKPHTAYAFLMRGQGTPYPPNLPLSGDLRFPTNGLPPWPGEDRPMLSRWGRLTMTQNMGGTRVIEFVAPTEGVRVTKPTTLAQINGDDADAMDLTVTLTGPRISPIPIAGLDGRSPSDLKEFNSNAQVAGQVPPVVWPPIYANVSWGTGGINATALVDFVNGAQISISGSFLRVDATIVAGPLIGINGTSGFYQTGAFVGPGIARTSSATCTTYIGDVPALAESAVFPVPPFARRATVISRDPGGIPAVTVATLRFWQSSDGVVGGHNVANYLVTGNQPLPFGVPDAAAYASVLSGMGAPVPMAILYELEIS